MIASGAVFVPLYTLSGVSPPDAPDNTTLPGPWTAVRAGIDFPHARLAARITRKRVAGGVTAKETVYAITDLDWGEIDPVQLADALRAHWVIENRLHWVRDATFDEDRSAVRTGHGPAVMATMRNLAISIHRRSGATNIARACRHTSRHPLRTIPLIS